ncbi:hypothetical protein Scani_71100 [Streptomyces caniferus]|uniref:Uncharacterized protein n=1 Tax=Streptomyces caniferus TaxID=285557 RepID=A0A640SJF4_9ACTN|nr:hypothetical protein Scani_71100 [Streptomyces caniferus]
MDSPAVRSSADPFAGTAYANSPEGWWTEYGGAVDVRSGVVYFPPGSKHVPCPWEDCVRGCRDKERRT